MHTCALTACQQSRTRQRPHNQHTPSLHSTDAVLDNCKMSCLLPQVLRRSYREVPDPVEAHVTRWAADPWARGSYPYYAVGNAKGITGRYTGWGCMCVRATALACWWDCIFTCTAGVALQHRNLHTLHPEAQPGITLVMFVRRLLFVAVADDLAAPHGHILFAGDATTRKMAAHSAFASGQREAQRVLGLMN